MSLKDQLVSGSSGSEFGRRRHRDSAIRESSAAPAPSEDVLSASGIEADLVRGSARLRFSPEMEREFRANCLEPRRRLLITCGVIGCAATYIGTLNVEKISPDVAPTIWHTLWLWELMALSFLGVLAILPVHLRRNWQAEAVTAFFAYTIDAMVFWWAAVSTTETAITHSATASLSVIYVCLAARQRFTWALCMALAVFVSYIAFVHGHTPVQTQIVTSFVQLMALSFVYVLVATYVFEYRERRNWVLRKIESQQGAELARTSELLAHLASRDSLTGLNNRRQFDLESNRAWHHAEQAGQSLTLLTIDADLFKRYNDTYGHPAGDECLRTIAQVLTKAAQAHGGVAARLGGEEFGLLLPGHSRDEAVAVARALVEGVRQTKLEPSPRLPATHITISVGLAQCTPAKGGRTLRDLVTLSDQALYQAKANGRNQVCAADAEQLPPALLHSGTADPQDQDHTPSHAVQSSPRSSSLAATLAGGFRWLRFPSDLEQAYGQRNAAERRRHLLIMTVVGLLVYCIYSASNAALYADVYENMRRAQYGLGALMIVLSLLSYFGPLRPKSREALFSVGATAVGLHLAWFLSSSHQFTALTYSISLGLIPLFAGVGAQQPFRFTLLPSVAAMLAPWIFFHASSPTESLVFADTVFIVGSDAMYTLILAYTLEYGARKEWLLAQISQEQREKLTELTTRLAQLSTTDPLTGVKNRRQFEADLQRVWAEGQEVQQPLGLLIVDVDYFKRYNDSYGHPQGDQCLKSVAFAISQAAQSVNGLVSRLGGEEFAVLLPGSDEQQALQAGRAVCGAVSAAAIAHAHTKVPGQQVVTASVGASSLIPGSQQGPSDLLSIADQALYHAKSAGRNQVQFLAGMNAYPLCVRTM